MTYNKTNKRLWILLNLFSVKNELTSVYFIVTELSYCALRSRTCFVFMKFYNLRSKIGFKVYHLPLT